MSLGLQLSDYALQYLDPNRTGIETGSFLSYCPALRGRLAYTEGRIEPDQSWVRTVVILPNTPDCWRTICPSCGLSRYGANILEYFGEFLIGDEVSPEQRGVLASLRFPDPLQRTGYEIPSQFLLSRANNMVLPIEILWEFAHRLNIFYRAARDPEVLSSARVSRIPEFLRDRFREMFAQVIEQSGLSPTKVEVRRDPDAGFLYITASPRELMYTRYAPPTQSIFLNRGQESDVLRLRCPESIEANDFRTCLDTSYGIQIPDELFSLRVPMGIDTRNLLILHLLNKHWPILDESKRLWDARVIVTANKQLMLRYGDELFLRSRRGSLQQVSV